MLHSRLFAPIAQLILVVLVVGSMAGCGRVDVVSSDDAMSRPRNLGFEAGTRAGALPTGWRIAEGVRSGRPQDYEFATDRATRKTGSSSLRISFVADEPVGHGGVYQCLVGPDLGSSTRRRIVGLSGFIKSADVMDDGASFWIEAKARDGGSIGFENMDGRRSRGTEDWRPHHVGVTIAANQEVAELCFGFFLTGRGTAWADELSVRAVPMTAATTREMP